MAKKVKEENKEVVEEVLEGVGPESVEDEQNLEELVADEFEQACLDDENVEVNYDVETDVEGIGSVEGIGAAGYSPRLSAPSTSDKNWLHYTKGGYNYCILIKGNSVLPNCVGYAWGRWRELLGSYHNLSRANAENWYGNTKDGYSRGQTPKLGAVICWRKGKAGNAADGAGHVAIVEKINADGSITTSNSNYGGTRFYTATYKYPYNVGSNFFFQGFIYNPNDYGTQNIPEPGKSVEEIAKEVIAGKWGNGDARKNALQAAGYNYDEVQAKVNQLLNESKPTPTKSVDEVAKEVIRGDWGNGDARKSKLEAAGYNYSEVQNKVNQILASQNSGFKVGDAVTIVGAYASSANAGSATNTRAIGWHRYITKIHNGAKFPYQIGNKGDTSAAGTTGYANASAIKK